MARPGMSANNAPPSLSAMLADNPVTARLVGLTPVLACSDSLARAGAMAVVFVLVLPATALLCSLTRHLVPARDRLLFDLILVAGIISLVSIGLQRLAWPLHALPGIYLPTLAGSALVWTLAEQALQARPAAALRRAFGHALAAASVLLLLALLRSGLALGWLPGRDGPAWPLPVHPAGGLLLLGGLLALLRMSGTGAGPVQPADRNRQP